MVTAIPDEWQWPGTEQPPVFKSVRDGADYKLRMVVQDLVAVYGSTWVAVKLADIAEELIR